MESKDKFIWQLIRHDDFLNDIFGGRIMERRPKGSTRMNHFYDVEEKAGCTSYPQLKEAAKDTHIWLL